VRSRGIAAASLIASLQIGERVLAHKLAITLKMKEDRLYADTPVLQKISVTHPG
jgi:hypothetical protein